MSQSEDRIAAKQELCARAPRSPGPWVALARELLAEGRAAEALAAAERALALEPRHMNGRTVRKAAVDALEAADPKLTALELKAVVHDQDPDAHLDLGHAYVELGRPADAERCFKRALSLAPDHAAAMASLAALYLSVGIEDGAEHYCREALALLPDQAVASQTLAAILERRGDLAGSQALLDAAYQRQSLFAEPAADSPFTVLVLATQSSGNIPYRHLMPPRFCSRLIWYMEHARDDQAAELPPYDLIFNAIGDPDLAAPSQANVRRFLAGRRKPLINAPDKIARTHRDLTPALLAGLEDVVTPATVKLSRDDILRLGLAGAVAQAGLTPPVLIRPLGSHGGKGLQRAETTQALAALHEDFSGGDAYATQYWDYRAPDGGFRKGRMIFVDRKPYPYHWAISDHWLVHYVSANMAGDPARQAEERAFLADPASLVGERGARAVARIGERLDLDYCGLDFTVLPDGRVLVFEANATMFVHPEEDDGEFAYKNPAVQGIIQAFQARVRALAQAADWGRFD